MSNHLKAITDRAKKIRSARPTMKWTDAVKKASQELGYGGAKKKVAGKSKTIIYAKPVKKKSGKTTLKVYARAKATPKVKPGKGLPPGMSVPRKPKPKPRKPSSTTYVTPKGKVYSKTPAGRKRILGTGYKKTEREWFQLASIQDVTFREDKDCLKFIWKNRQVLFPKSINSFSWDKLVTTYPIVIDFISSTKIDTDRLENLPQARKLWNSIKKINLRPDYRNVPGYEYPGAIKRGIRLPKKGNGLKGISYKTGQPLMSLSGYPMRQERIFIGSNATCCAKMRKMKPRPKNVGELEKLYSVPEIEVKMVGRKGIANGKKIQGSETAALLIRNYMDAYNPNIRSTREMFGVMYLNFQNNVIGIYVDGIGGQTNTAVDMQYALVVAIKLTAKACIIFHNHPSGNLTPSPQDAKITDEYGKAFPKIGCQLIDHIILSGTDNNYYSFGDNGNL